MDNKNLIITGVVALIVGLGVGYFGAHALAATPKTGAAAYAARSAAGGAGVTGMRAGNQASGAGLLTGTVAAVSAGSITLNTRDGSSHVVLTTPDTTVSKSVTGSLSDVTVGSTIIVSGTTNSDGSVSATLVQLRPAMPVTQTPTQN
jgi:hypothetical protein